MVRRRSTEDHRLRATPFVMAEGRFREYLADRVLAEGQPVG